MAVDKVNDKAKVKGNPNWVKELNIWKHRSNSVAIIYPLSYSQLTVENERGWDIELAVNKPDVSIKNWQLQKVYVDPQTLKRYSIQSLKLSEVQDYLSLVRKWVMVLGEELPIKEEPD